MNTTITPRKTFVVAGIALALSGCGGDQNTPTQAKQAEKSLRMGGAPVTTPYTDALEIIATNAYAATTTLYIPNQWGGHQTRITHHNDGTIRLIYITASNDPVNAIQWNLKKRDPVTGTWSTEATGLTTDDINLLRDPQTDAAYVVAYPNSVPTVYSGPSYAPTTIGGTWQNILAKNRHYGAAGIGADGTLCLKTNVDLDSNPPTSNTRTDFTCGNYVSGTGWVWKTQQQKVIGYRYTYDYMFPGGLGTASQLVATSQSDLQKLVEGYTNSASPYIFNGFRLYSTQVDNSVTTWNQYELQNAYPGNYDSVHQTYVDKATVTKVPQARMNDTFINSQHIVFSTYFGLPGSTNLNPAQGLYMVVSDASGNIVQQTALSPTVQPYGGVRIFEDSQHRMWLLWTGQGNNSSNMVLYRLVQNGTTWSLGTSTSLGSVFNDPNGNFSIDGPAFLALPRGGQAVDNVVYASIAACGKRYTAGQNIQPPYYPNGENTQNILHFRIHLPD